MKRKIFLILLTVFTFGAKAKCQTQIQTLSDSVENFSSSAYAPGDIVDVTIGYVVTGVNFTNVTITCTLPSSVKFISAAGGDTTNGTVVFNLGNIAAAKSSLVDFKVEFLGCSGGNTATFAPIISADNTPSFTAVPRTAFSNGALASTSWLLYALYDPSTQQYNVANPSGGASVPIVKNFFYNNQCTDSFPCDDGMDYYFYTYNAGKLDLKNAVMTMGFNQNASGLGLSDASGNSISPTVNEANASIFQLKLGNLSSDLQTSVGTYFDYFHLTIDRSLYGQQVCFTPTLTGTNFCDGSPYLQAYAPFCITIEPSPYSLITDLDTYVDAGTTTTDRFQVAQGCDKTLFYSIGNNISCTGDCTQSTIQNAGINVVIPHQVQVNNITLPTISDNETATLTGHYYYTVTNSTYSFSFPFDSSYEHNNGDVVQLSQLITSGYIPADAFMSDYKIATSLSSNTSISLGECDFTVLPVEWPAMTTAVTVNENLPFAANFISGSGNIPDTANFTVSGGQAIDVSNYYICDQKSLYCIGDTINYKIAFQNVGKSDFSKGVLQSILPQGFQYVPNSAQYSSFSVNQPNNTVLSVTYPFCSEFGLADFTSDSVSSIIPNFPQVTSATTLTWQLPTLNHSCHSDGNIYVLSYKVVITSATQYENGSKVNSAYVLDSSGNGVANNDPGDASNTVNICEELPTLTPEQEVSSDEINWSKSITAIGGQSVYYRIKIKNDGDLPLSQIKLVGILPAQGDPTVKDCFVPRNSTIFLSLLTQLTQPPGESVAFEYSQSESPQRAQFLGYAAGTDAGCENGTFSPIPPSQTEMDNYHSFQIDYGTAVLQPGDSNLYVYSTRVPPLAASGNVAYNSFAVTATVDNAALNVLQAAESPNAVVTIINPPCQCVEGTIWVDSIANGIQDSTEMGHNGISLAIYNAVTNAFQDTTVTTYDSAHVPGHYEFCGLPAGSYYIKAYIPDSLINSPTTDSSGIDSTKSSDTSGIAGFTPQVTATFTISCNNTTNNNVNVIIMPTTNCDDDCSKRRPVIFRKL
jgi:uncharacterized repeat protein (TIGR01451 family)